MPDFEFTSPEGKKYTVTGPDGATKEQAFGILQSKLSAPPEPKVEGKMARIGHGLMDPIYGAAQMGARMPQEGEDIGALVTGQTEQLEKTRAERVAGIDSTVKKREQEIQAARPKADRGSTDWLRVAGSVPSAAALSAPTLAVSGIPGAIAGGAMGGMLEPTTDTENFGKEKAKSAALGGVAGGVLGAAGKAAGAGIRALGGYLARQYPENVMTAAVQKILKRIGQDEAAGGPTAQQAIELINEANPSIKAWHGSPSEFEKFDLSKLHTGEGSDTRGRGVYLAENRDTGQHYADFRGDGHLYQVNIRATPDQFIDWDKPLSQQSPRVRKFAAELGVEGDPSGRDFEEAIANRVITQEIEKRGGDYSGITPELATTLPYDRMKAAGIAGNRYLDAGSSQAGKGTSNYVVFDDKNLQITSKNGQPVLTPGGNQGKPLTLADVGGENTRALAGNVTRQPGEGRNVATQFLNQRDRGAGDRLTADVARYVHGGESMHRTTEAMLTARSAAARPAWDAVRSMEGVWSPRLQQFVEDPAVRRGMARGYEIERLESLAENRPFDPTQLGVDLDEQGNIRMLRTPNMRVLHLGKMGLDAMIGDERNEITGRLSQRGVALDRVRRAYLQEIDGLDHAGTYRNARALWEGPAASMDAMRAGRTAFTSSPDEIAGELAAMTPANREFYRLGVADSIREKLMKTGFSGNDANAIMKNPWMREQLRAILPNPADFDAFVNAVTRESTMFGTRAEMTGGSQTAKRLAEDDSTENKMAAHGFNMAGQVATGKWHSALHTAVRMWRDRQDRAGNPKLNEQIARILFQTPMDPEGEVAQRLTGRFTGPESVNRLAPAADMAASGGAMLAPGAGSALSQPPQ